MIATASRRGLPWLPPSPRDVRTQCRNLDIQRPGLGQAVASLAWHDLEAGDSRCLSRSITRLIDLGATLDPLASLRLAVLPCRQFDLVSDALPAAAARHGVALKLYVAPGDRVETALLDPSLQLEDFDPDLVLVDITTEWLGLDRAALEPGEADALLDVGLRRLTMLVRQVSGRLRCPTLLQTLVAPKAALFGSADRRIAGSPRRLVERANALLVDLCDREGAILFDAAAVAEASGTSTWLDARARRMWGAPFSPDAVALYADHLARLLGAFRGRGRKCLVLDLDETIWGGVVGDDGVDALEVGPGTPVGESFAAVQRLALDLKARGVLLAVASKNNEATAREPFRRHPGMLLRETDISIFKADWRPKAEALEAIARELNIGLESLVLLDDNPVERASVRAALPQVAVPELSSDPSDFAEMLAAAGLFDTLSLTEEDRARSAHHRGEAQRLQIQALSQDLNEFLSQLEMRLRFEAFHEGNRTRVVQLIGRSNQFNLTTRRHAAPDVERMQSEAAFTQVATLSDRYGDYGLISVLIATEVQGASVSTWEIDTWLMSCRASGRRVEEAVLTDLVRAARDAGVVCLEGVFRPTSKNAPVADHYMRLGFRRCAGPPSGEERYRLDLAAWRPVVLPFHVVTDGRL